MELIKDLFTGWDFKRLFIIVPVLVIVLCVIQILICTLLNNFPQKKGKI